MERWLGVALALLLVLAAGFGVTRAGAKNTPADSTYYVALGDSLTAGLQPDMFGIDSPSNLGFVDDLYETLQARMPHMQLMNLGCGGTTTTLIHGGDCNYQAGSQLSYAREIARDHAGAIALVTVDIGDNDVDCMGDGTIDYACVKRGMASVRHNLPIILNTLRDAVGPKVEVAGLVDYDQFLAYWLKGDRSFAIASTKVVQHLNQTLRQIYQAHGVSVANAAGIGFNNGNLMPIVTGPWGRVPLAVQQVCTYTWACAPPPQGFDDHANTAGYKLIAGAFARVVLPRLSAARTPHEVRE